MKRSIAVTHSWVSSDNQWRGIICWCCQLKIAKGNLLAKPHAGHFICARSSRLNTHKPHFFSLNLEPTCSTLKHRKQAVIPCNLENINSHIPRLEECFSAAGFWRQPPVTQAAEKWDRVKSQILLTLKALLVQQVSGVTSTKAARQQEVSHCWVWHVISDIWCE